MLDTKLEEKLQPIREDVQDLKEEVHVLKEDVQDLKEEVHVLKEDMQDLKEDVEVLKEEVHVMKGRICVLQEDVQHVKLYQENILEPRLNTIEACYTSTYGRYKNDVDKMETAFDDIDMLKQTVARHSEQLRKMA
ncbi:MAG: hypothetical protein K2N00_02785, partial [Lachnospiraceae bacterium]|nr:hypothetical protein [Lachnospiraceae bacterium]